MNALIIAIANMLEATISEDQPVLTTYLIELLKTKVVLPEQLDSNSADRLVHLYLNQCSFELGLSIKQKFYKALADLY